MGTKDDVLGSYARTTKNDPRPIKVPDEPGLYEVRYVLSEGRKVLGRATIEVVPVTASITAPSEVVAGAAIDFSWEGPNRNKDRIELVPADAPLDAQPIAEARTNQGENMRFTAPEIAGEYRLRYRLAATDEVVGSADLTVAERSASLTAAETVAPGEVILVSWTGPGAERDRIALAEPDQGPFQWIAAQSIRTDEGDGIRLTAPNKPGRYELRYLDVANRVVLVTRPIEVR
jgi:Ca-activated chloride channel family protein